MQDPSSLTGIETEPRALQGRFLTAGLPRKSPRGLCLLASLSFRLKIHRLPVLFSFWGSEGSELLMHLSRGAFLTPSLFSSPHALAVWEGGSGSLLEPSSNTSFESSSLEQMQGLTGGPRDRTHKLDPGSEFLSTVLAAFKSHFPGPHPQCPFLSHHVLSPLQWGTC